MARPRFTFDAAQVRSLAARGLTMEEIALSLRIGISTLYKHKSACVEFMEAIKQGQADGAITVTNALYEEVKNRNLGAIIWYEKTRRGLRETTNVDQHVTNVDAQNKPASTLIDFTPAQVRQAESVLALRERVLKQLEQDDEADTVETTGTTVELNGGFINGTNGKKG
jgi:hypothetical protein